MGVTYIPIIMMTMEDETDEKNNLRGSKKLERLVSLYGEKGFDYAGDSSTDIVIFPHCRNAHLINASDNTIKKATKTPWLKAETKNGTISARNHSER